MKTESIPAHLKQVRYKFHSNGSIRHHCTVLMSKTKGGLRQAIKRFYIQNPHVQPD